MGMIAGAVVLAATGVPQSVASSMLPALPSVSMGGVTYPAGSATEYANQITMQAAPGNAGPVLVGKANMNAASGAGVGFSIAAGQQDVLGQFGSGVTLDDVYVQGTAGDKVYVQVIS